MTREHDIDGRFAVVHGKAHTPEWLAWNHMMLRCYNPLDSKFKDYGARGIVVCDRWQEAKNFLDDMGMKPSKRHTLGRIDNNGSYCLENCRWETPMQQARNRRSSKLTMVDAREIRMLEKRGYTQTELAREFGVSQAMVWDIIHEVTWSEDPSNPNRETKEKMKNALKNSAGGARKNRVNH